MMMPPGIGDRDSALLTDGLHQFVDVLAHGGNLSQVLNLREVI